MFLAVDVGNTHTTLGIMEGTRIIQERRLTTNRASTADELQVVLRFMGGIEERPPGNWSGAALCSVAPAINKAMCTAVERVIGIKPLLLNPSMELGIRNRYANPNEVGMDRLANAVAGVEIYGAPLVIVDFGTATTLDIVSREGDYLGGLILPGLEATADALYIRTSKLPQISIERPATAIGQTTVHAMQAGIYFGAVDAVQGARGRIEAELGYEVKLVATGGLASTIGADLDRLHAVDPEITLRGIQSIWKKNNKA